MTQLLNVLKDELAGDFVSFEELVEEGASNGVVLWHRAQ